MIAGRLTARYGARPVILAAALTSAAGQLCLLLISVSAGYLRLVPALIGVGVGVVTNDGLVSAVVAVSDG